jgi:hypothetical protein
MTVFGLITVVERPSGSTRGTNWIPAKRKGASGKKQYDGHPFFKDLSKRQQIRLQTRLKDSLLSRLKSQFATNK